MTPRTPRKPGGKMNAVLEWKGRKLMCCGFCIAEVAPSISVKGKWVRVICYEVVGWSATEALARRSINRRFKQKA